MKLTIAAPLGVALLLAACSGEPQAEKAAAPAPVAEKVDLPDTGSAKPIELAAIGKGELLALEGARACRFTIDGQDGPALVVKTDVATDATAQGAVKVGSRVQRVAGPGGFAELQKGMDLSGPGLNLIVEPSASGAKAKLAASRPFGKPTSFEGDWSCDA
ncbi:hypothetical protein [Sphingopyxis sp. KK2]|uniref:hypothetical protein n=1 Tax=Sphingopyxis sp. KK2 TaxID=1855727 RepID=UPI00097E60BC|nr:hypothetical protein [Sphingopyxis sp. KK2]